MRHVLTMAIGVSEQLRMHSYTLSPQSGAQVLLCSDGLHGSVDSEVIAQTLATDGSLETKCQFLIEEAKRHGGPDNITAVILRAK
jgi:protein phosphatase